MEKSDLSIAHFTNQIINITRENVITNKLCVMEHMECAKPIPTVQVQPPRKQVAVARFSSNVQSDIHKLSSKIQLARKHAAAKLAVQVQSERRRQAYRRHIHSNK
jgi:hypothetical protein